MKHLPEARFEARQLALPRDADEVSGIDGLHEDTVCVQKPYESGECTDVDLFAS